MGCTPMDMPGRQEAGCQTHTFAFTEEDQRTIHRGHRETEAVSNLPIMEQQFQMFSVCTCKMLLRTKCLYYSPHKHAFIARGSGQHSQMFLRRMSQPAQIISEMNPQYLLSVSFSVPSRVALCYSPLAE